jgi:hypothetical protein
MALVSSLTSPLPPRSALETVNVLTPHRSAICFIVTRLVVPVMDPLFIAAHSLEAPGHYALVSNLMIAQDTVYVNINVYAHVRLIVDAGGQGASEVSGELVSTFSQ